MDDIFPFLDREDDHLLGGDIPLKGIQQIQSNTIDQMTRNGKEKNTPLDCSPITPLRDKQDTTGQPNIFEADKQYPSSRYYEPYEHRKVAHPLSYSSTLFLMIKGALGTGILTMPHAFKNAGYLFGFVGTLLIGAFTTACIQILVRSQYELCRRKKIPYLTYSQILGTALSEGPMRLRWLAPYGECLSFTALVLDEIGALCIYLLFIASNLREVFIQFTSIADLWFYMLCLFPPILLISWLPHLKYIVPLSSGATGIMIASLGICLRDIFTDFPSLANRHPVGRVTDWPLFVGTTLFSLSSIGVTMPLENEMQDPRQLTAGLGVLNVASAFTTIVFASFGLVGYLKYGNKTVGSITLNLPSHDMIANGINLLLCVSILVTFALPHFIVHDVVWTQLLRPRINTNSSRTFVLVWEYISRTSIVLLTFALSFLVPNLELFVSLTGALCLSLLSMWIPAIVNLLTFWHTHTGFHRVWFIGRNIAIILVACFVTVTGVYVSLENIARVVFKIS
uniref:Proton-coupled amino acid transporter 4 n=1 Tax=Cacopsylla melanoneura TaxID=428564 RepID=A0A8D8VXM0_9HEMI